MGQKISVNGLANIGQLIARNPDAAKVEPPKSELQKKVDRAAIVDKTLGNLHGGAAGSANQAMKVETHNLAVLQAAVRDAYNLGHKDALDQNGAVEAMLDQQYKDRTALTLPAAMAAFMEQCGLTSLLLDLPAVATVFSRVRLVTVIHNTEDPDDAGVIEYTLHHLSDDEPAGDATFGPAP